MISKESRAREASKACPNEGIRWEPLRVTDLNVAG